MKNKCALALDIQRNIVEGSPEKLREAIRKAANLRVYTEFRHNEHIDTSSTNNEMIREVSDFPATYLIDDRWAAGIMTLRQPVGLPGKFGEPSMSFFMYNENGQQAIARPYLHHAGELPGDADLPVMWPREHAKPMVHMHILDEFDNDTNAPCSNFIYDFYSYKFMVQEDWEEVLSHDADGNVISGSASALDEASGAGCDIKVAISGICDNLFAEGEEKIKHELFIQTGPHYYYDETGFMVVETRPFVRVKPSIPVVYKSHNWDFGWAIARSDGHVAGLFFDPYTLKYRKTFHRCAMRWFIRSK